MSEKYSFGEELAQAEKDFNIGGEGFKFVEGENRFRVLSAGRPIATHRISPKEYHTCYGPENGCPYHEQEDPQPNVKFAMWILDRRDGKIKLAFMPYTIVKALRGLQENPDYTFEELPMPYDLTVTATKAGTKEVEYAIVPARKNEPLRIEEEEEYSKKKPIDTVIADMRAKERGRE